MLLLLPLLCKIIVAHAILTGVLITVIAPLLRQNRKV